MTTSIVFSAEQKTQLRKCESVITKGTKGFFEMCDAFRTIKTKELFKGSHDSFPAYLRDQWDMDASTVSRYIKAAEVLEDLKDSEKLPTNEGQCRVLGKLTPDQRRKVWSKVLESDEKPTGKLITDVAKEMGFPTKPDDEQTKEAPEKEPTFLSRLSKTADVLSYLADTGQDCQQSIGDLDLPRRIRRLRKCAGPRLSCLHGTLPRSPATDRVSQHQRPRADDH